MKNKILILAAVLFSFSATAQKKVTLTIKHMLGSAPFAFNQAAKNNLNNDLTVTRIDYYISKITIIHDGAMQTTVPNKYIFVQGNSNLVETLGNFNVTNVEGIKFHIGVDSPNNTSDPSQWTGNHPLAPKSPAMHWGWAAGFRFVAIEGNAGTSLGTNYQLHGLFDANYFEQTVMAPGVNNGNDVVINLEADYTAALKTIDVTQGPINHGDNTNDLTMLQNFRDHVFSPGTGIPVSVSNTSKDYSVSIYPNPSSGNVRLSIDMQNSTLITGADVYDMMGRKIQAIAMTGLNEANIHFGAKGMYLIQLKSFGINIGTEQVLIK